MFLGAQTDVRPFYGAADVFALPTIYDPLPNAALEALACGLPVLTTTTCGAAELLTAAKRRWSKPATWRRSRPASIDLCARAPADARCGPRQRRPSRPRRWPRSWWRFTRGWSERRASATTGRRRSTKASKEKRARWPAASSGFGPRPALQQFVEQRAKSAPASSRGSRYRKPVKPLLTVSVKGGACTAITGVPQACASMMLRPSASFSGRPESR
jgi:hypothetical protein